MKPSPHPAPRALIAATLLLAAAGTALAPSPRPRPFADGFVLLERRDIARDGGARARVFTLKRDRGAASPITLVLAIAPKRAAWASVRPVQVDGPARATYAQHACPGALAAVNGSFFHHDARGYRPMGLVRVDGRTAQPPSPRRSGGFLISDGSTFRVVPKATPAAALAARFAVESAPILIQNGRNGMRADDMQRHDRVAGGVTGDGDLVLAGAFTASGSTVSLWEFEKLIRAAATDMSERLADVLAFDGGPSAHLFLPGPGAGPDGGELFGQPGRIYTPNVVCIGVR